MRMQKMMEDLLRYSRLETDRNPPRPTDANAAVVRALWSAKIAVEQANAVVTHDPLPTVLADEVRLVEVFQRLIDNAVKFRGEAPPRIHISAESRENEWVFSVRDNGVGIEPKHLETVFDVFRRLDGGAGNPGAGIGLAACKKIVELHGGRIWAESARGKGSTFYFTIPKDSMSDTRGH